MFALSKTKVVAAAGEQGMNNKKKALKIRSENHQNCKKINKVQVEMMDFKSLFIQSFVCPGVLGSLSLSTVPS